MAKYIFLHAGLHKTGTTSFQHYLQENKIALAGQNFCVVNDIEIDGHLRLVKNGKINCFGIAHLVIREDLQTPMRRLGRWPRLDEQTKIDYCEAINRSLHEIVQDSAVISAEAFSFLRTDQERGRLDRLLRGFHVRPLVVLRERTSWMRSWRTQVERMTPEGPTSADVRGTIFDFSGSSWLLDHLSIKQFFGSAGRYLSYEKEVLEYGSIVPALLREMKIEPLSLKDVSEVWKNRTPL